MKSREVLWLVQCEVRWSGSRWKECPGFFWQWSMIRCGWIKRVSLCAPMVCERSQARRNTCGLVDRDDDSSVRCVCLFTVRIKWQWQPLCCLCSISSYRFPPNDGNTCVCGGVWRPCTVPYQQNHDEGLIAAVLVYLHCQCRLLQVCASKLLAPWESWHSRVEGRLLLGLACWR